MSYEPSEHEPNHGQVNHRFAGVSLPLVVASEPAVTAKPTKGALYNPASGHHFEDVKVGSFHDLNGAMPHSSAPIQQGPRVASVGPDMFDASASLLAEESRQQLFGAVAVLDVGRQDHDHQQQPDCVDQNVAFASVDFLARIVAALVAALTALDALAVYDARASSLLK